MADSFSVLAVATLATYVWRGLGVAIASRIGAAGGPAQWFSCVAYAMVAGLIARMLLLPAGALAETQLFDRLFATGAGLAVFFLSGRKLLLASFAAFFVFVALAALRAG